MPPCWFLWGWPAVAVSLSCRRKGVPVSSAPNAKTRNNTAIGCLILVILSLLITGGCVLFSMCSGNGMSKPAFYQCEYQAELAVKRQLTFPATFDRHGTLTMSMGRNSAVVTAVRMDETGQSWRIKAPLIFGAANAFGVKSDYIAWYTANVRPNGDCWNVKVNSLRPYLR